MRRRRYLRRIRAVRLAGQVRTRAEQRHRTSLHRSSCGEADRSSFLDDVAEWRASGGPGGREPAARGECSMATVLPERERRWLDGSLPALIATRHYLIDSVLECAVEWPEHSVNECCSGLDPHCSLFGPHSRPGQRRSHPDSEGVNQLLAAGRDRLSPPFRGTNHRRQSPVHVQKEVGVGQHEDPAGGRVVLLWQPESNHWQPSTGFIQPLTMKAPLAMKAPSLYAALHKVSAKPGQAWHTPCDGVGRHGRNRRTGLLWSWRPGLGFLVGPLIGHV